MLKGFLIGFLMVFTVIMQLAVSSSLDRAEDASSELKKLIQRGDIEVSIAEGQL